MAPGRVRSSGSTVGVGWGAGDFGSQTRAGLGEGPGGSRRGRSPLRMEASSQPLKENRVEDGQGPRGIWGTVRRDSGHRSRWGDEASTSPASAEPHLCSPLENTAHLLCMGRWAGPCHGLQTHLPWHCEGLREGLVTQAGTTTVIPFRTNFLLCLSPGFSWEGWLHGAHPASPYCPHLKQDSYANPAGLWSGGHGRRQLMIHTTFDW